MITSKAPTCKGDIWRGHHAAAFEVAKGRSHTAADEMRTLIAAAIQEGSSFQQFERRVRRLALQHRLRERGPAR